MSIEVLVKKLQKFIPYILFMYGIFFLNAVEAQSTDSAYIKFKDVKYNFGLIKQGTVVKMEYTFRNTGKTPLIISTIETTCGCTVGDFPHYPIKSGDSGMILLTFNTKEKYDKQDRTVEVISNASNSPTKLRFKGAIIEPVSEKK